MAYQPSSSSGDIVWQHLGNLDGATQAVISFWFKPYTNFGDTAWGQYFSQYTTSNGIQAFLSGTNSESMRVGLNSDEWLPNDPQFPDTNWHHMFIRYDGGATPRIRQWMDGTEHTSWTQTNAPTSLSTNTQSLRVGGGYASLSSICELAVWTGCSIEGSTYINALKNGRLPTGTELNDYISYLRFYAPMRNDATAVVYPGGWGSGTASVTAYSQVTHPASVDVYGGTPSPACFVFFAD